MAAYLVKDLSSMSWEEWDHFVSQNEGETLFALSCYCKHLPHFQRIGVFEKDSWIAGMVFPVTQERDAAIRTSYIIPYILPVFRSRAMKSVYAMQHKRKVWDALIAFLQNNYASVALPIHYSTQDYVPFMKAHFNLELRYTYGIKLTDPGLIWEDLDVVIRNHIRKANAITIMEDAALEHFDFDRALHYEPDHERAHWQHLVRGLVQDGFGITFVASLEERPVGGLFLAYDNFGAHNLLSYFDKSCNVRGIPSALIWHSIKYALNLGLKFYDFEGSVLLNIETFFQSFGGKQLPYCQVHWNRDRRKMNPILYEYE